MAKIDVTEILSDPDFSDPVTQEIREERVNNLGKNILLKRYVQTIGIVQPASGKTISRLPDKLQVADVRSFWLKGEIHGTAEDKYPDILIFENRRYQVQLILPWTNWGNGWCEGVCVYEGLT